MLLNVNHLADGSPQREQGTISVGYHSLSRRGLPKNCKTQRRVFQKQNSTLIFRVGVTPSRQSILRRIRLRPNRRQQRFDRLLRCSIRLAVDLIRQLPFGH